jgi:hypothetical protein
MDMFIALLYWPFLLEMNLNCIRITHVTDNECNPRRPAVRSTAPSDNTPGYFTSSYNVSLLFTSSHY